MNKLKKKHSVILGLSVVFVVSLGILLLGVNGVIGGVGKLDVIAPSTAVFGNSVVGSFTDQNDANAQSISYFTCSNVGSVTDIVAYISGVSNGNAKVAFYGDDGTLIVQSGSVAISQMLSWVDFSLPYSYVTTAGHAYGLAILGDVPINVAVVTGSGTRDPAPGNFASGFSNPYGSSWSSHTEGAMSIYASGSTVSPSPVPTVNPLQKYVLTVNTVPSGGGTFSFAAPMISVSSDGLSFTNYANAPIGLLASPNSGYTFSDFAVQYGGQTLHVTSNPYNFYIQSDMTITVDFAVAGASPTPVPTPIPHLDSVSSGSLAIVGGGSTAISGISLIGLVSGKIHL